MKKIPFRITVVALFIFFALLIIASANIVQVYSSKSLAQESTNQNFKLISSKITEAINNIDIQNQYFIDAISYSFSTLDSIETILNEKKKYIYTITRFLKGSNNLLAAYFAFNDKSFFEIMDLDRDERLRKQFQLQNNARWLVVYIQGNATTIMHVTTYDEDFNLLSAKTEDTSYDPTSRPWYKNAIKSENIVTKTAPYLFAITDSFGITYAKQFNPTTIVASDILVNYLEAVLKEAKTFKSMNNFLFFENGELLSSTTKNGSLIKELQLLLKANKHAGDDQYIYEIDNSKYIVNVSRVSNLQDEYFVSIVLLDEAMEKYSTYFNTSTILTIILFIIFIPIIWYLSFIIVKPVLYLKEQSETVKGRDYSNLKHITSHVREIQELSDSMVDMAQSIHHYQHELEHKVKERTKLLEEKNRELERVSITDKLTNIYNRIKLDSALEEQILRAKRYGETFSIVIVDVDYFKKVNDTHGHQVGDTILIEFASILKGNIREVDIVGRWGGEEFVIISPHTSLDGIIKLANTLRQKINSHRFPVIGNITASFGVTTCDGCEDSAENVIRRADQALYMAKENGRDRVETCLSTTC